MRMAAYCRVSTESEAQLSSLENQREFFLQYANKCGDSLVKIYADEGISGKSMKKREAFCTLLADSANNLFDYVAVKDISRFARNTSDFLYGIRTLRSNGVDVRFLSGNQTVIGESEFVLTVFAALAQEESANLSKRIIFGKRQNAKKGRVPNTVYGYDKIDTYTLQINEYESDVVKLIFKWYTDGMGTRNIAETLNNLNIPTKKHSKWFAKTIRRILENPIYIGNLVNNKSTTDDFLSGTRTSLPQSEHFTHHRPELQIISSNDFELVQNIIRKRKTLYSSERYSSKHIFSNLIVCNVCGRHFTAYTESSSIKYHCPNRKNCKNTVSAKETELLSAITNELQNLFDARETAPHCPPNINPDIFFKSADIAQKKRDKYMELFLNEIISLNELKESLTQLYAGVHCIKNELDSFSSDTSYVCRLMSSHTFTNSDMRALISKISIAPDNTCEIFFL